MGVTFQNIFISIVVNQRLILSLICFNFFENWFIDHFYEKFRIKTILTSCIWKVVSKQKC